MEIYDWLVVALSTKVVWKCATMKLGGPFVMMVLTLLMQQSSVDCWDSLNMVLIRSQCGHRLLRIHTHSRNNVWHLPCV